MLEGDTNGDRVADFGIELSRQSDADHGATSPLAACSCRSMPPRRRSGQTLNGGPLDDTLSDGGFASVTMIGGKGNDTYVVDNAATW